jgi:hypothetical protein
MSTSWYAASAAESFRSCPGYSGATIHFCFESVTALIAAAQARVELRREFGEPRCKRLDLAPVGPRRLALGPQLLYEVVRLAEVIFHSRVLHAPDGIRDRRMAR